MLSPGEYLSRIRALYREGKLSREDWLKLVTAYTHKKGYRKGPSGE